MDLAENDKVVDPLPGYEPREDDRLVSYDDEAGEDRSKFVAFLMGGVVIAGGMLAFLYYDSDNFNPDNAIITGSITRYETPSNVIVSTKPANPDSSGTP